MWIRPQLTLFETSAVAMGLTPLPERPQCARLRCLVPRGRCATTWLMAASPLSSTKLMLMSKVTRLQYWLECMLDDSFWKNSDRSPALDRWIS